MRFMFKTNKKVNFLNEVSSARQGCIIDQKYRKNSNIVKYITI